MNADVVSFTEALEIVRRHAAALALPEAENVALPKSLGRVLAGGVEADRDQPPFDRSTRDGFAVRAEEWRAGASLRVLGEIRAGQTWQGGEVPAGCAVGIMTGAAMPPGGNAVAMVEHMVREGERISPAEGRRLRAGENVVPRGAEAREGGLVVSPRTRVGAAEIALAAACGEAEVAVFRRPRVAVMATGDELVEVSETPGPQQIRNSNSYAIAALVETAGGEALRMPIVPDVREAIWTTVERARGCDLLVLSGGVSMGEYDLVEEVLASLGAEFFFTGVRMQPGKPVVFGRLPERGPHPAVYFFGLPGNPISTQVTFRVFVETMLRGLGGAEPEGPQFVQAVLAEDVAGRPGLTRLLPARMEGAEVRLVRWQGSGDLAANARANCYALLPEGRESFGAGEAVRILLR